jgi:hypothetical protein
MRRWAFVGFLALAGSLTVSAGAQALPAVQIDMREAFNADVIVNGTTLANLDETQSPFDLTETSLITQGAAKVLDNCTEDPDGLSNRGRFAANDDHPLVDLAYDNEKNGKNARRSLTDAPAYTVPVPRHRYRAIHVLASSGNGASAMGVKLLYKRGPASEEVFIVADWFGEQSFADYTLVDGRDRADPDASVCHDDDTAAIWGFKAPAKARRTLRAVRIVRMGSDSSA